MTIKAMRFKPQTKTVLELEEPCPKCGRQEFTSFLTAVDSRQRDCPFKCVRESQEAERERLRESFRAEREELARLAAIEAARVEAEAAAKRAEEKAEQDRIWEEVRSEREAAAAQQSADTPRGRRGWPPLGPIDVEADDAFDRENLREVMDDRPRQYAALPTPAEMMAKGKAVRMPKKKGDPFKRFKKLDFND